MDLKSALDDLDTQMGKLVHLVGLMLDDHYNLVDRVRALEEGHVSPGATRKEGEE